jgi:hypothetical protein
MHFSLDKACLFLYCSCRLPPFRGSVHEPSVHGGKTVPEPSTGPDVWLRKVRAACASTLGGKLPARHISKPGRPEVSSTYQGAQRLHKTGFGESDGMIRLKDRVRSASRVPLCLQALHLRGAPLFPFISATARRRRRWWCMPAAFHPIMAGLRPGHPLFPVETAKRMRGSLDPAILSARRAGDRKKTPLVRPG